MPPEKKNIFIANFFLFSKEKWFWKPNRRITEIRPRLPQSGIFDHTYPEKMLICPCPFIDTGVTVALMCMKCFLLLRLLYKS